MPKHEETSKQRVKDQYRAQARAGAYDDLPEFRDLVASRRGFEPEPAIAALAHHNNNPKARGLLLAIKDLQPRWSPALAPLKTEGPEGEGGGLIVQIAPWAGGKGQSASWEEKILSAHYLGQEARQPGGEYLQRAWEGKYTREDRSILDAPEGSAPEEIKDAPAPAVELDRAALIAKLPKADKREAQDPAGMPPLMKAADEYTRQNAHTWVKPPKVITRDGDDE